VKNRLAARLLLSPALSRVPSRFLSRPPSLVLSLALSLFLPLCWGLMLAGTAFGHHGTANYDTEKNVSVKGTVTDFQYVNPHVLIYMDVKDESGKVVKWQGELTSPNRLERSGWHKDTIKPGDVVTIGGYPAKSGSPEIWILKVIGPDGQPLQTAPGN
jgi:hypothetical protein